MEAKVTHSEEIGRTISYALDVEVDDGREIHVITVTVVEIYDCNSGSHTYEAEVNEWKTVQPLGAASVEEIEEVAKEAALKYVY